MTDPRELPAIQALEALNIPYKRYEHPCALTMEDCEFIGADVGAHHCKNLFLCNRQATEFYLMLISAKKKFRTAEVSKQLGVSRLSFCTPEQLMEKLKLLPGSVTPMALINDPGRTVTVVIDEDVAKFPMLCVHPLVSTASLAITGADLMKFLHHMGHTLRYVSVNSYLEDA